MKSLQVFFFLIIFFAACSADKVPSGIIKEKEMVKVLVDLHIADGYANVHYTDVERRRVQVIYQALYKKYNTDSLSIRRSIEYYTRHPDVMITLYDQVNAQLEEMSGIAAKQDRERSVVEQKRYQDSLYYNDHSRDSLYRGFKSDTMSYGPFRRYRRMSTPAVPAPAPAAPQEFVPTDNKTLKNNIQAQ